MATRAVRRKSQVFHSLDMQHPEMGICESSLWDVPGGMKIPSKALSKGHSACLDRIDGLKGRECRGPGSFCNRPRQKNTKQARKHGNDVSFECS